MSFDLGNYDNRAPIFDLGAYKSYYFVGIGGISMSSLALILKRSGMTVRGYDRRRTAATISLENEGIEVFYETDPKNCEGAEVAVFTAAVTEEHPEMLILREKGIPIVSRATLLGAIARGYGNAVAVAGTHGKSTTCGMLSQIFLAIPDADPTILLGAKLPSISSTFRTGRDKNFIFEACEYKDSFLEFFPTISVVLNVELDHTDYFGCLERIIESFRRFIGNTAEGGAVVVNGDCPQALECLRGYQGRAFTYSIEDKDADYYAEAISFDKGLASYELYNKGKKLFDIKLSVPGLHNVRNSLAAIAAAHISGVPDEAIVNGIKEFCGVCRRFELRGELNGAIVYDDYAHHPDEIRATLAAAKSIGYKRIISVFQPHTYSRLHDLFDEFASAFGDSDLKVFAPVYSARESDIYGIGSADLAAATDGIYFDSFGDIADFIRSEAREDDLVLFMGAGDIDGVIDILLPR